MKKLIRVAVNDLRLVFRDNSLKVFIVLPLLTLVVMRYGVPYAAGLYKALGEYIAVIMMMASMQGSIAFGFIYSMVLVDEKDTNVAKVYGIVPVSKFWFTVFRLVPPFLLATFATVLLLLVEPFYGLPMVANLAYSALAGLVAPMMALFIAAIATNKIEAMTWQKLSNIPLFLPILAFFVPAPVSVLFAAFPSYWAYQAFNALVEQSSSWTFLLAGFVYSIALLTLLIHLFIDRHFR